MSGKADGDCFAGFNGELGQLVVLQADHMRKKGSRSNTEESTPTCAEAVNVAKDANSAQKAHSQR